MRTLGKTAIAFGFAVAMAIGGTVSAGAFEINGPGFHVWVGDHHRYYDYGDGGYPTWNGCPPDWTIQGGACKPYRHGPWDYGYGWYR
jgi:hypothetical protein